MGRTPKIILSLAAVLIILIGAAALISTWIIANDIVHDPVEDRDPITKTPADFGLPFETLTVTTPSGITLAGWYIPSENGAAVLFQHGFEENRQNLLEEAAMLQKHGYGVLLGSVRGHDQNGEEMITFGCREMEDIEAWYQHLLTRDDVDPERIGILGQSMGGSLAIQYAKDNEQIRAVVAHSPLTSFDDVVDVGLREYTPIPDPLVPFLKPLVIMWGEQITGCDTQDINAKEWIGEISPRPVYLICGGQDRLVIEENCRSLYAQAREPVTFWFEDTCAHHDCDVLYPEEFEERLIEFIDVLME